MIELCKGPADVFAEYVSYLPCNFEEVFELCVRSHGGIDTVVSWLSGVLLPIVHTLCRVLF